LEWRTTEKEEALLHLPPFSNGSDFGLVNHHNFAHCGLARLESCVLQVEQTGQKCARKVNTFVRAVRRGAEVKPLSRLLGVAG
jgi:hypothetical protein